MRRRADVAWAIAVLWGLVLYQKINATGRYATLDNWLNSVPHSLHYPLRGRAGDGPGERDGGQGADQLGGYRCREPGRPGRGGAGQPPGRRRVRDGQAGRGALPGGDALAGQHAEAGRERLGACVQGSMAQFLVAGVRPAAGSTSLAGIRAGARFSSRVAR